MASKISAASQCPCKHFYGDKLHLSFDRSLESCTRRIVWWVKHFLIICIESSPNKWQIISFCGAFSSKSIKMLNTSRILLMRKLNFHFLLFRDFLFVFRIYFVFVLTHVLHNKKDFQQFAYRFGQRQFLWINLLFFNSMSGHDIILLIFLIFGKFFTQKYFATQKYFT
jgi:hypothetical protein